MKISLPVKKYFPFIFIFWLPCWKFMVLSYNTGMSVNVGTVFAKQDLKTCNYFFEENPDHYLLCSSASHCSQSRVTLSLYQHAQYCMLEIYDTFIFLARIWHLHVIVISINQ
jgi:hypothetical protein